MKLSGNIFFWKKWDDETRATAAKITGLLVAAFTLFTLISCFSYIFNWKAGMSGQDAAGVAGQLGFKFGRFLVCDCFGLGSLAILVILTAVSMRLLLHKWLYSMLGTTALTLTGAFLASLLLAFFGQIAGIGSAFGGGLGGWCGTVVVEWAEVLFGSIITGVFILVLIAIWLLLGSKRFSVWFNSLSLKKKEAEEDTPEAAAEEPSEEDVPEAETIEEPADDIVELEPAIAAETATAIAEGSAIAADAGAVQPLEVITDDTLEATVTELPRINNRLDPPDGLSKFKSPSIDLLDSHDEGRHEVSGEELARNNNRIRAVLSSYKIDVTDVKAVVGPTVTLYKVYPSEGVRVVDIRNRQDDIAMLLGAHGVRIVSLNEPGAVGIEVPNDHSSIVPLKSLLNDKSFRESKAELPVALGYTITQKVRVFDLADAPHLLIAGATKQGKSVGLNVIVSSLLYSKHPSELKFVFIDPKMVEFSSYAQLYKHYLAVLPEAESDEDEKNSAIVKYPKQAEKILRSLCIEMDQRYELLSKAGVNKITLYNDKYLDRKLNPEKGHRFLPYLVVVVDEYADLTMTMGASAEVKAVSRSITNSIIRLAQKGRAAGLHVILATQRPSVDVISGIIKSNFPMRIAFRTASRTDSMTILDANGAEKLIGRGDMLFAQGIDTERIQCGYLSGEETDRINGFISSQTGWGKCYNTPYYLPIPADQNGEGGAGGNLDAGSIDEHFEEAARVVVMSQKGSTSDLQRKLGMGYARAGKVMDQLEQAGIVGPQDGSKPRQVLVPDLDSLEPILKTYIK